MTTRSPRLRRPHEGESESARSNRASRSNSAIVQRFRPAVGRDAGPSSSASPPSGAQRAAQHLPPLAEGGGGQPFHGGEQGGGGLLRVRRKPITADTTFGGGQKAAAGMRVSTAAVPVHCASTASRP